LRKRNFGKKKKKRRKGGKVKGERTGRINLVPEGRCEIIGGKLEAGQGNIKTETVNYNYLLCSLLLACCIYCLMLTVEEPLTHQSIEQKQKS